MDVPLTRCPDAETIQCLVDGRLGEHRRAELIAHADDCASCRALLVELVRRTRPSRPATPGVLATGDVIDRYVIEERLGAGGMGVVYAARDPELERRVALKLVRCHVLGDATASDARARLRREARALARISHPNVITVHDIGTLPSVSGDPDSGEIWVAMELIDGGTIRQWAARRPRTWREILEVFLAAGRGLAVAHAHGLVHRDVKPDNILVGHDGCVRVTDFGMARAAAAAPLATTAPAPAVRSSPACGETNSTITRAGTLVGTPAYMAPEQLRGQAADPRADQFGFCVALHEMLYGIRPFAGHDLDALVRAIDAGEVRASPPERRAPVWLRRILVRGLRADPADRYPSMDALVAALSRTQTRRRGYVAAALALASGGAALAVSTTGARPVPIPAPACLAPSLPDLYVAATSPPGGNGSIACPFRTVTEALGVGADTRVIHVAAGRYDTGLGEHFPLVVRGATSIRGAGAGATILSGAGYGAAGTSTFGARMQHATLVIGDRDRDVALSGLTVEAGPQPSNDQTAIVCTRGNLGDRATPAPPANTHLDGVVIGGGYQIGIIVAGEIDPDPTGCNLDVVASYVHGQERGLWQVGCGIDPSLQAPTALRLSRSVVSGIRRSLPSDPGLVGIGLLVWDCARLVHVEHSVFQDGDTGIAIVRHDDGVASPVEIVDSHFDGLDHAAVALYRSVQVDRFEGNQFHHNRVAVALHPRGEGPRIRGRDNQFQYNDVAIAVSDPRSLRRDSSIDFGRRGDPGGNLFACNHHVSSAALPLAGNIWTPPARCEP